jgi:hypothetical protein
MTLLPMEETTAEGIKVLTTVAVTVGRSSMLMVWLPNWTMTSLSDLKLQARVNFAIAGKASVNAHFIKHLAAGLVQRPLLLVPSVQLDKEVAGRHGSDRRRLDLDEEDRLGGVGELGVGVEGADEAREQARCF